MQVKLVKDKNGIEFYSIPYLYDIQKELLELLKIIDKVAKDNNIKYWIDGGTLLGAIRHKSFIPWDDDIDVCLMKDEYDRFLPLLNDYIKTDKHRSLLYYNNKEYHYWFEYFMSDKIIVEYNGVRRPVRIDIFPMKLVENDLESIEKDKYITDKAYYFIKGKVKYHNKIKNKYKYKKLNEGLNKKNTFLTYFNNEYLLQKFTNKNKDNLLVNYSFGDIYVGKERDYFKYTDIFPIKNIEFEACKFMCPNNTDVYLKTLYGDYMQLPSLENRIQVHNSKIIVNDSVITKKEINSLLKEQDELFFKVDKLSYKLFILYRQTISNGFVDTYNSIIKPFIIRKLNK